jgi:hypothetical protein
MSDREINYIIAKNIMVNCIYDNVPMYTKDVKEAIKLFEYICDPNRTYIIPCGNGTDGLWWAVYYQDYDGDKMIASDKSLSMAICKYALKELNINIEGE